MEYDNQATSSVQMLKSGETVFLYYDHLTEEQDQCLERTDSSKTSNSSQTSLKSPANQDEPSHMYSIGTQTDHDVIYGSAVAMTTRNGGTKGRNTTSTKSYNSISTETDLNAIGNRKTLESLLRWALAICTSDGDLSGQDAQEFQNRNTSPLPSFPQVYQQGNITSDSQHSIDLERAKGAYSTKENNDISSDVVCKMFREDHHQDGDFLDRLHSSTLGSSDDMQADENLIQSLEIQNCVSNELQSTATDHLQVNLPHLDQTADKRPESCFEMTVSDHLQVNSLHLDQTPDRRQEASIGMTISDHLPLNLPQFDQTPDKRQESGIGMPISDHLQAPDRAQDPGGGMARLRNQSINMHVDQHLPVYAADEIHIKEEYVRDDVIHGGPIVEGHVEAIADYLLLDQSVSSCTSTSSIASEVNKNTSQSTNMASPVVLDNSCGMEMNRLPENHPNDMERSTQSVETPYECDVCGKRYKARYHLNAHLCVRMDDEPFQCDVCGNKFMKKWNFKVHKCLHSKLKEHACTVCTRKFAKASNLRAHMRLHSQENPYACTMCTRKFTQSSSLRNHMRLPCQEKPYACTICKRRFAQSGHLKYHMSVHTGERPYVCQVCGKGFTRPYGLKEHSAMHSREKQFTCNECGKTFRSRSSRDKHVRIKHESAKSS